MGDPYGLPEDLLRLLSTRTHLNTQQHVPITAQDPLCVNISANFPAPPPSYQLQLDPPNNNNNNMVIGNVFFSPHHQHDYNYYCSSHNILTTDTTITPTTTTTTTSAIAPATDASDHGGATNAFGGIESTNSTEQKGWLGFDYGNNNRWPRQETLSLLEVRSRLDSKFRDNNHKAPLWNEISRIMAEEFGYQRSGKKCKEKFENLYKYYKKTKEGKACRQDGKHYRFFRQLEAICGETTSTHHHASTSSQTHHHVHASSACLQSPTSFTIDKDNNVFNNNNLNKCSESPSFSNSSDFETTSSSENIDEDLSAIAYMMKHSTREEDKQKGLELELEKRSQSHRRRDRKSWRSKVEELVDSHMKKIIETQDAWMEKMLGIVEQREQEMVSKEEERKKKESMRFDQEVHELWAKERKWVETRDAALIEVVKKHIGKELEAFPLGEAIMVEEEPQKSKNNRKGCYDGNDDHKNGSWTELEISNLIQLRTGFEQRLRENNGYLLENGLNIWDEIAAKMACLGFHRTASECNQIWDEISISLRNTTMECGANTKTRPWFLALKLMDDDDS